jgi:hypothetical protein
MDRKSSGGETSAIRDVETKSVIMTTECLRQRPRRPLQCAVTFHVLVEDTRARDQSRGGPDRILRSLAYQSRAGLWSDVLRTDDFMSHFDFRRVASRLPISLSSPPRTSFLHIHSRCHHDHYNSSTANLSAAILLIEACHSLASNIALNTARRVSSNHSRSSSSRLDNGQFAGSINSACGRRHRLLCESQQHVS